MDIGLVPNVIRRFLGLNDSSSPIIKVPGICEVAQNFELSQDFALNTRRGSMLMDYATRLKFGNNAAFIVDEFAGVAGNLSAGTRYYIGRYRRSDTGAYSLPTRAVVSVVASANATNLVQITFSNNPDPRVFDGFQLLRTVAGADAFDGSYYEVTVFNALTLGLGYVHYQDGLNDNTLDNGTALLLNADGLDLDQPVTAIIDFKRRIGGGDLLFIAGKYIKSYETGDKIYDGLTKERMGDWLIYQNAVWYVDGKEFIFVNDNHQVYEIGGPAPDQAPTVSRVSGPLSGVYRWVYTFYDDGAASGHPWESNPSDVSASLDLDAGGAALQFTDTNAPARVTHRKIYRTVSDGRIEEALLVDTILVSELSFFDTFVDPVIGPDIVPFDYNDPPSDLRLQFIIEKDDRIYGGGNPEAPTTLYWARRGFPEQWSEVNNRLMVGDEGDKMTGLGIADGNLIVFMLNATYMVPDDPPLGALKLGFKRGAQNFRCIQPVDNGLRVAADNSVYFFNGNAIEDCADYIARFFEERVDPTLSTLKMSQMVEYSLPTKKQIIVLFKTTDKGLVNSVARVYHPYVARANGDPSLGWTEFTNFKATTLQVVKNTFNRDMLLLGGEDGRIYIHDVIPGQDRAEVLNFGAAGAPFIALAAIAITPFVENFDDLAAWTINDNSGTIEIAPAGQLHILMDPPLNESRSGQLEVTAGAIDRCTNVKISVDMLRFQQLPTTPVHFLLFNVFLRTSNDDLLTALTDSFFTVGLGPLGVYGIAPNSNGGIAELVRFAWEVDTDYDLDIYVEANGHASISINGVGYSLGVQHFDVTSITPYMPITPGKTDFSIFALTGDESTPERTLELTINSITINGVAQETYDGDIERYIDGEAILYVYESPWLSLDEFDDVQKFLKRLALVCKANFNGTIDVIIYSDFVEAGGQVTKVPVNGGTLWDIALWDKATWDGLKETVGSRAGVYRIGKHFKVRIELSDLSTYLEIYGLTVRHVEDNALIAPKADEGVPEK